MARHFLRLTVYEINRNLIAAVVPEMHPFPVGQELSEKWVKWSSRTGAWLSARPSGPVFPPVRRDQDSLFYRWRALYRTRSTRSLPIVGDGIKPAGAANGR